jgi:hypothetical protein
MRLLLPRRCLLPVVAALAPSAAWAADSDTLVGIHWWGLKPGTNSYWQGIDPVPAQMLDSVARGAWDVEVVNTHGDEWQKAPFFQPLYSDLYRNKNVSFVTRLEYKYEMTVPSPSTINTATWAGNVVGTVNQLKDFGHVWQLGNEPNLIGEGNGWANNQITPGGYAAVYKAVRDAIHNTAQVGPPGAHQLLVAPVSPGGVIPGVRWQDGNVWLGQTIDAIRATGSPIDGFSLHAYGGGDTTADALRDFRNGFATQVAVIDAKGQTGVPIHITEMNRGITVGPPSGAEEQRQADFARGLFAMLDRWNRIPGNHNIVSANWFVYDSLDSRWDGYSIEYWKDHGNAAGGSGDLYTAYSQIARAGYRAGLSGTRPLPPGVRIFDDFETGDGRFAGSLTGSSLTAGASAASSKTRTADDAYTKAYSQKLSIVDNPANANGWYVHYPSAGGNPASNDAITLTDGPDGNVGFFLRVLSNSAPSSPLTTQLILDNAGGTDAGVARTILADGDWHYYEWNLDDPSQWTAWRDAAGNVVADSDGVLASAGAATIDSIVFRGGNANVQLYFDGVMYNANGSLAAMLPVPEPAALALAPLAAAALLRRRRR